MKFRLFFNKKSIGFRIGIFLLISMLIMGAIIALVIIPYTASVVTQTIESQSELTVKSHMKNLRLYVDDTITGMNILGKSISQLDTENEIRFLFTEVASKNSKYSRLSYIDPTGKEVVKTGIDGSRLENRSQDVLFKEVQKNGVYISPILADQRFKGNYYIDMAIVVKDGTGLTKGVLVNRIDPDLILSSFGENKNTGDSSEQISTPKQGTENRTTVLFMLNQDQQLVATSNQKQLENIWSSEKKEKVTLKSITNEEIKKHQAIQDLIKNNDSWSKETKVVTHTGKFNDQYGVTQLVAYAYDPAHQWSLFLQTNQKEALADVNKMRTFIIIVIFFGSIILASLTIAFIRRTISKPMNDLVSVAKEISEGDLTKKVNLKRNDEIGILANAFDAMVEGLRVIVKNVKGSAEQTNQRANELSHVALEVSEGAGQIAVTIQEIAKGAEKQSNLSYKTEEGVDHLHQMVFTISDKAKEVSKQAGLTQETIHRSDIMLGNLIGGIETLATTTMDSAQNVKQLQDYTKTIGEIIVTSNEIAKRTNLLALNAAIEAARAGEQGKGFAVVANEIRQLAEQSSLSSKKIEEIIDSVRSAIEVVVIKMEQSIEMVSLEREKTSESKEAFNQIELAMTQVINSMGSIIELIQQQKTISESIFQQAKESSNVSEATSAGAEEVAASTQQSAAIMEQVVDNATYLLQMAKDLKETVDTFRV